MNAWNPIKSPVKDVEPHTFRARNEDAHALHQTSFGSDLTPQSTQLLRVQLVGFDYRPPQTDVIFNAPIKYFGPSNTQINFAVPEKPLRIAVITSLRDVGIEEGVGKVVSTSGRQVRFKGSLEILGEALQKDLYAPYFEVVSIITDDTDRDLKGKLPPTPMAGRPWIHPNSIKNAAGEKFTSITVNIPSDYRKLPLAASEERAAKKMQFEQNIYNAFIASGADVILSDHLMLKIENLLAPETFGLQGRILNTHVGMIRGDHPAPSRGADPYQRALEHAEGIHFDEATGKKRRITPYRRTGATLHYVTAGLDEGPVICEHEGTPVIPAENPNDLMYRLYRVSKDAVLLQGLKHFASHLSGHAPPQDEALGSCA